MLATQPMHCSNERAVRTLTELEYFLADLSMMNIEELQHTSTTEPLHVSDTQASIVAETQQSRHARSRRALDQVSNTADVFVPSQATRYRSLSVSS